MEIFNVRNEREHVRVELKGFEEDDPYDGQLLQVMIDLKCGTFRILKDERTSQKLVRAFYEALRQSNENLEGTVSFSTIGHEMILNLTYEKVGKVQVECYWNDYGLGSIAIKAEFTTDQTFITAALQGVEEYLALYGDH
ncbi:hypothetical protein [Tumebacillus flagellatus]|uniref:Uncharacterized protein n=1 Tax=Tumebacillus flagellatus TaxID=1157490 RepID=A0A074LSJ1_9BACL|nr:hypothetical protein [Tumebacillus flagellatus]KEO82758.1 hypothetical protein EL26_13495 [Tumebacillus flagellatus]